MTLLQDRLGTRLVLGAGIAVEKQNGAGLDAELLQTLTERHDLVLVERPLDLAVREHALLHLEAQRPLDQRHMLAEEQVVGVGPVDAADLVDVAKALGDEERGPGAGALQDRVDRHRRAVQEQPCRAEVAAGLLAPRLVAVAKQAAHESRFLSDVRHLIYHEYILTTHTSCLLL